MTMTTEPKDSETDDPAGLREHLALLLNPVDAVLLTRERLQEVLDDAVRRGRMTRSDATDLVQELVSRGRANTEAVLSDVDQLLGSPAGKVRQGVDRARRATGLGGFPIKDYDELTAAQITQRLGELDQSELRQVREHERRNGNRKTVLAAIESKLA
jgi:hypothetical protein